MNNTSVWERTVEPDVSALASTADFDGECRLHVSVNVSDLRRSVEFYRVLFGVNPAKIREGYAKFSVAEPPLNFSVNEFPNDVAAEGHLGVQLKNTRFIREAYQRLQEHGFKLTEEDGVACCYAVQTKFWAADPDGHRWEMFVTTEAEAEEGCGPDCICHVELERTYLAESAPAA